MKKSSKITLTLVAAAALAACSRRRDPCEAGTFNEMACQDAVRSGGYYWGGSWYPMHYSYPYPYYYDSYRTRVRGGGSVVAAPYGSYGRPGAGPAGVSNGGGSV